MPNILLRKRIEKEVTQCNSLRDKHNWIPQLEKDSIKKMIEYLHVLMTRKS